MTAEELTEINALKKAIDKYEQIIEVQTAILNSRADVLDDLFIKMISSYDERLPEDKIVIAVMFEAFKKHVIEMQIKFTAISLSKTGN